MVLHKRITCMPWVADRSWTPDRCGGAPDSGCCSGGGVPRRRWSASCDLIHVRRLDPNRRLDTRWWTNN